MGGIFNHRFHPVKPVSEVAHFVDVGGNGDCGFRAIAAGILDVEGQGIRSLETILSRHFSYFPGHQAKVSAAQTPGEQLRMLSSRVRLSELLPAMAYTLRQLAVDELCNNPDKYRGAFVSSHEGTTPEKMRQRGTWIDESSIAALATCLGIPVIILVMERKKELPLRLTYGGSNQEKSITIKLSEGHYVPRVVSTRFDQFLAQPSPVLEPTIPTDPGAKDPSMDEIFAKIAKADQFLIEEYRRVRGIISAAIAAGELDKSSLMSMYINSIPTSDYLEGHHDLRAAARQFEASGFKWNGEIEEELAHALTQAIVHGQVDIEEINNQSHPRQSMRAFG